MDFQIYKTRAGQSPKLFNTLWNCDNRDEAIQQFTNIYRESLSESDQCMYYDEEICRNDFAEIMRVEDDITEADYAEMFSWYTVPGYYTCGHYLLLADTELVNRRFTEDVYTYELAAEPVAEEPEPEDENEIMYILVDSGLSFENALNYEDTISMMLDMENDERDYDGESPSHDFYVRKNSFGFSEIVDRLDNQVYAEEIRKS